MFKTTLRLLVFGLVLLEYAAPGAAPKPNFIFILTDDQRYDALGVVQKGQMESGRFPWLTTPNMDRVANEGVRFRNAFVTLSLCAPSRSAFLTGIYNHNNGVVNNHMDFPAGNTTYAELMRKAGYATAFFGKFHHDGQKGNRPGFSHSASFIGQGVYFDCPFEVNGKMVPTKGWVDDVSTEMAIDFIRENRARPFSIMIGYKAAHSPVRPPERARERFAGVRARPVPSLTNMAVFRTRSENPSGSADIQAALKENNTVPINVDYFRCLSALDDDVGRILKVLDDEKLAQDTVVVFAGDNGYYMGEHGLGDKRSAYEESLRVPLLMRYPRLVAKGEIRDEMVLNIDLAPTFLELAGLKVPATMQGSSWIPLLKGGDSAWRKAFLFDYFLEARFPNTPTLVGIRTTTAKLVEYPGHEEWTELFDLAKDPYEQRNLAESDAGAPLLQQMKSELAKLKSQTGYHVPETADKAEFSPDRAKKKKGRKRQASE